jgi:ferric-dicitrate binding protein FerR (iron transport regulator)
MNVIHETSPDDDGDLAALLQRAGGRDSPPAQAREAIWAAVHTDWQAMVQENKHRQRRVFGWCVAAGVASVGCATLLAVSALQPSAVTIATIEHIDGRLIASSSAGSLPSVVAGGAIVAGEALRTDSHSRAALRWPGGLSLRLDHDTAIKLPSPNSVALVYGTVYVDALGHDDALSIETPLGTVRHLGTQYMIVAHPELLDVSIREGRVSIGNHGSQLIASAGERIRMSAAGAVERTTIGATDVSWEWTAGATATFQIDNQSLAAFLAWVSRQTGRPVVFESAQAQSAAAGVVLRGSIEGLDPDTALSVVLSTTRLHRYPTADDSIGIALNKP